MKQSWIKLGKVFCPCGQNDLLYSHATNPVAEYLSQNRYRVYFSSRDKHNRGQIASIEIEIEKQTVKVCEETLRHVLSHGKNGYFDDNGVTVTGFLHRDSKIYLYYLGWNLCRTIPFRNSIGLAVSEDDGVSFSRYSVAPIVDRNSFDPISLSYPFIMNDNETFRMWYGSCEEWNGNSNCDYFFSIKYAESNDGINWIRTNKTVIKCNRAFEDAIARPHITKDNDKYRMWYSKKKGLNYSIGYAESNDGSKWERLDINCCINVSDFGWDSEMIEYPYIFDHEGFRYMLYNGNGYGKTGFGIAVLE